MLGSTAWLPMSVREHHLRRLLLLLFGALVHAEKGNETKAVSQIQSYARALAGIRALDFRPDRADGRTHATHVMHTVLVSFPFSG